jgi:hypothetical protein
MMGLSESMMQLSALKQPCTLPAPDPLERIPLAR